MNHQDLIWGSQWTTSAVSTVEGRVHGCKLLTDMDWYIDDQYYGSECSTVCTKLRYRYRWLSVGIRRRKRWMIVDQ